MTVRADNIIPVTAGQIYSTRQVAGTGTDDDAEDYGLAQYTKSRTQFDGVTSEL